MACSLSSSSLNGIHHKPIEQSNPTTRDEDDNDNVFNDSNTMITSTSNTTDTTANRTSDEKRYSTKVHTVTVCVVPPPDNERVWTVVSDMRRTLQDPGYFRWPPHINLLYPFLKLSSNSKEYENEMTVVADIVQQLEVATSLIPPFRIKLDSFGTFGGKNRGVLWLHPESSSCGQLCDDANYDDDGTTMAPLIALQQSLERAFPMCRDQSQKGESGKFVPHMTVSHFPSRDEALQARTKVESQLETNDLQFLVDRIYLLERKSDNGQFLRVAEIALGEQHRQESFEQPMMRSVTKILELPREFPGMPDNEEEWIRDGRMKMKERRRGGNRRRGGGRRARKSWNKSPRVPDTTEVIAAKLTEE
jgi:2'-5' RNA ligase